MSVYDRVKFLADNRDLSIKELATKIGISDVSIYGWKKTEPKGDTLKKTAQVLNTSTDYLLGLTKNPKTADSSDDMTPAQKEVAYFIDPRATEEDIEQIKKLVEIAKLSKRRL